MDERDATIADLRQQLAEVRQQLAAALATIAELRAENDRLRRSKGYPEKRPGRPKREGPDRRAKGQRQHPGSTRDRPDVERVERTFDLHPPQCRHCGSADLEPAGVAAERIIEDLPPPKVEVTRERHHAATCRTCGKATVPAVRSGHAIGPRARLLAAHCRAELGISLGKTCTLLDEWFGLRLSRAGALGHLAWAGRLFDPVVQGLLERLRAGPVLHADETSWRIDGKLAWCWCFANPEATVYLIDRSRSRKVFQEALGDSYQGVLVTDFYAVYDGMGAKRQRCLAHLLRALAAARAKVRKSLGTRMLEPVVRLIQDALALAKRRAELPAEEYAAEAAALAARLADQHWRHSKNADVERLLDRLHRHRRELLVFLTSAGVPADMCEREVRGVAATRADGGVNRTGWGARAFAAIKSVTRTCRRQGLRLADYGLELLAATRCGLKTPLPLAQPA